MRTYENMKIVINGGKNTKEDLLSMCDIFLMNKRINGDQFKELIDLINAKYPEAA